MMQAKEINAILNTDDTLPKPLGVYVIFCPETKFTRYVKSPSKALKEYPMNSKYTYYISYNTFGHYSHHDKDVLSLNALWLDFDCVNNNIPVDIFETAIPEILNLMGLPKPNHCIMSGNGFHFVWFFSKPKITHSPIFTKLWVKLEETLINLGQKACSNEFTNPNICDNSVNNPSRLMRIVGSYNNKHGKHILVRREPDFESKQLYSMQWFINEYMPTLKRSHNKKNQDKAHINFHKYLQHHREYCGSHNTATLNYGRYYDLKHLVQMRNGKCTGNRDIILFTIACQLSYVMPTNHIINCVEAVNDLFNTPLPQSQMKDFTNEVKHLDFRNYKLHTNKYLIQKFNITPSEQNNLAIIKEARHSTLMQHAINHANRMKYLKYRTTKIKQLHKSGLSVRKIAKRMKISIGTVSKYLNH